MKPDTATVLALPVCEACSIANSSELAGALYDHFGWRVQATPVEVAAGRLAETHEYFHRQLDDTTAFGGLLATVAALADAIPDKGWTDVRARLQAMSDLVHETFAVGMSLLTTQRRLEPIVGYPTYDRHVRTVLRLLGDNVHPWVALAALRAAATACMQSDALAIAAAEGLLAFDPTRLPPLERPNHRLAALLNGTFATAVAAEETQARDEHGAQTWWRPSGQILLAPEAMDGEGAEASELVHRRMLGEAKRIIEAAGGVAVAPEAHHDDLRALLAEARRLAPEGLTRIGALVEAPGGELLHGGPLDGQIVELTVAPRCATVLPYGSLSGLSGEGAHRHAFVVVTTRHRLEAAYELEGVSVPAGESVACLRTTVFDGETRDSILLLPLETPSALDETVPIYVSVLSSAAAADPDRSETWMRSAAAERVSMVMDTPATAALRRWCANGTLFRTATRLVRVEDEEVRIIAGRLDEPGRYSPLVLIPSTEFGARWFETARVEDPILNTAVVEDPDFFERESAHLDVVLTHILYEERYLGTGSWRR